MRTRPTVIYYSPSAQAAPDLIISWSEQVKLSLLPLTDQDDVATNALRTPPAVIFIDADGAGANGAQLCRLLKTDPYTAIVPVGSTMDVLVDMTNPGEWMVHCHIAEHLESGMKFVFEVEDEE